MTKQRPLDIHFQVQFKIDLNHPPILEDDLAAMFQLRQRLRQFSSKLDEWLLGGDTKKEAFLYSAFDENGPTTAVTAVLKEKARQEKEKNAVPMRSISLWNGEEGIDGASMRLFFRQVKEPSLVHFDTYLPDFLTYVNVLSTTQKMIEIWKPLFVSAGPFFYDNVFKDRPGVGWMLYLPRTLTVQQVPEARALVPVMGKDEKGKDKQTGTIIVSVTDEPFSDENPDHVKIANAIEVRLVDQDLLPRFMDL